MPLLKLSLIKNFIPEIYIARKNCYKFSQFSTVASSNAKNSGEKKKKNSGFDERKAETEALNKFFVTAEQARGYLIFHNIYYMIYINNQFKDIPQYILYNLY